MALINDLYVFVKEEQIRRTTESTSHPVEKGVDLVDHVKNSPVVLSLSGKIVSRDNVPASEVLSKLIHLQKTGALITYSGRNICYDMQIQSFDSTHPNNNWGGLDFEMELKEVRIAKSAYIQPQQAEASPNNDTVEIPPTAEISVGSTVVFKGGAVYVSSTASKPAANRGRSTCEVTIMNNNAHPLHCISKDGQLVYGWVDRNDVEASGVGTSVAGKTNGGTQQVL